MRLKLRAPANFVCLFVSAVGISFVELHAGEPQIEWRTDIREAAREAQRQNLPMLLQITAGWCGHCQKMLQQTYTDGQVVARVNACFIPVKVDADEHEALVEALDLEGLPSTVVVSTEMEAVKRLTGYKSSRELLTQLAEFRPITDRQSATTAPGDLQDPPDSARNIGADANQPGRAHIASDPDRSRFAFNGLCLVSLLDKHEFIEGSAEHAVEYQGKKVCFASAGFLRQFQASPERYWPVFDGCCPVSAVDDRDRRNGDPEMAIVYRGRIWLCADELTRARFAEQPRFYAKSFEREPATAVRPMPQQTKRR